MAKHNDTGKWGEDLARDHLIAQGYAIVDTNARIGHYELDIVAMKDDKIIFVEVKTRTDNISDPLDAIDQKKIRQLCRAADAYIRNKGFPHEVQFDVITIVGLPDSPDLKLTHYPDAFLPPLGCR